MSRTILKSSLCGGLILIVGATSAAAIEAAAPDPCLSDERCLNLHESARNLSKAGQYAAALSNYQEAHAIAPSADWLLVNIGRIQQKLGKPKEASEAYKLYLQSPSAQRDSELVRRAREYLQRAEQDQANPEQHKGVVKEIHYTNEYQPRPKWRLGVGGALIGVGAIGIAFGAYGLAINGHCVDDPIAPASVCMMVRDGLPAGIGFLVSGGVVAVAGTIMLAWPGQRNSLLIAHRTDASAGRENLMNTRPEP